MQQLVDEVANGSCGSGAVIVFTGTTRDFFEDDLERRRQVERLEYECYAGMALKEMRRIVEEVEAGGGSCTRRAAVRETGQVMLNLSGLTDSRSLGGDHSGIVVSAHCDEDGQGRGMSRFKGVHGVSCAHRLGVVPVGEASVVIAVASEHRVEGFDACRYVIDELKKRVPIWKKEIYAEVPPQALGNEQAEASSSVQEHKVRRKTKPESIWKVNREWVVPASLCDN